MVQQPSEVYDLCWMVVEGKKVPKTNTDFVAPTSQETFKYMTRSLTKKEKISLLSRMISGDILVKDFPSKCQNITRRKKLQHLLILGLGEQTWEKAQQNYHVLREAQIKQWIVSYDKEFKKTVVPKSWTNFIDLIRQTKVVRRTKTVAEQMLEDKRICEFSLPPLTYKLCNIKVSSMLDTLKNHMHIGNFFCFCSHFSLLFFTFFVVLVVTFFIDLIVVDPPYGLKKADWDDKPWGINELYVLLANLEQLNSNVNATSV